MLTVTQPQVSLMVHLLQSQKHNETFCKVKIWKLCLVFLPHTSFEVTLGVTLRELTLISLKRLCLAPQKIFWIHFVYNFYCMLLYLFKTILAKVIELHNHSNSDQNLAVSCNTLHRLHLTSLKVISFSYQLSSKIKTLFNINFLWKECNVR